MKTGSYEYSTDWAKQWWSNIFAWYSSGKVFYEDIFALYRSIKFPCSKLKASERKKNYYCVVTYVLKCMRNIVREQAFINSFCLNKIKNFKMQKQFLKN